MAADAAKRNSFRAVKNQKIACDFLIFYRSLKFYLPPQAAIRLMRQLLLSPGGGAAELKTKRNLIYKVFSVSKNKVIAIAEGNTGQVMQLIKVAKAYAISIMEGE
jgi:hypothetical protein